MERTAANQNPSFAGILHLIVVLLIMSCVSRIICEKGADCVLEENDPQTPICGESAANITLPEDYESFAGDLCQADCEMSDAEEDDTKRCRFWRFVSWTSLIA